jgi:hypothetical protein
MDKGLTITLQVKDNYKVVDTMDLKPTSNFINCLSFDFLKLNVKTDVKDAEKENTKFKEFKQFLKKYN